MSTSPIHSRRLAACVCLLAVLLLHAPFLSGACLPSVAKCCASGLCAIPEHHHKKTPAPKSDSMDCGHDMSGMSSCSMDCCNKEEKQYMTAAIFILPPTANVEDLALVIRPAETARAMEISQLSAPLSPPPRFASLAS